MIARELEHLLRRSAGEFQRLPTEAALCEQYACSRQTVRSALGVLEEKGLIVRRQGSGSYPAQTAAKSSRQIAVVLADKEEYLVPTLLRELRKAASEAGFTITCLETGGSPTQERVHLTALLHRHPAGLILEPITDQLGGFSDDLLNQITDAGVPLVYLNGRYGVDAPVIQGDDAVGTGLLAAHLFAGGHRKIAAILKSDDSRGAARYRGLLRGAADHGMVLPQECCLWYSEQERLRLLEGDDTLLQRFLHSYRRDCSAVVCFNDEVAFRLMRLMEAEHITMAVVSFDNSYLALSRDIALTTLGLDPSEYASSAIQSILDQMDRKPIQSAMLPWKLFVRKSG